VFSPTLLETWRTIRLLLQIFTSIYIEIEAKRKTGSQVRRTSVKRRYPEPAWWRLINVVFDVLEVLLAMFLT
jgi:hypothetical protein